ncbi:ABC transporter ATP-binding protein [Salinarchaeum sp. Harcht-Bsk1]|uniref:ABC transporter ATP-binding protein n=1 Tax=Salinarchaeum sp. Harcht-Bsk1 TaxID=1333523 RepID=UPI001181B23F|nr:ABC transporter ATP-binding protein [Salinarchaeum sp. Harcht-Bsk1]
MQEKDTTGIETAEATTDADSTATPAETPMIQARNLTKRYGDLTAVDGVDITVERGSIHGFVGPNGAGKSTTMQMLTGLVSPTAGEVRIGGDPAGSYAATAKIGYAPQEPAFYESMTGRNYLVYMGRVAGMGRNEASERADELLEWLDLADAADQTIGGYSGGMARKLGLAQAMIHDPELLILDEPTATLDPEGRASIIDSLQDLTEEGMTVFVSSHVLAELERFVDTVTILAEGQVARSGPLEAIRSAVSTETYVVDTTDNDRLATLLADHPTVERVERRDGGRVAAVPAEPEDFTIELQGMIGDAELGLRSMEREDGLEEAVLHLIEETQNGTAAGGVTGEATRTAAEGGADAPEAAPASDDPGREGGD